MSRQHTIREYELFVSGGVQEVPEGVFERETRASGEYRVVRAQARAPIVPNQVYEGIQLEQTTIDLSTGEIISAQACP